MPALDRSNYPDIEKLYASGFSMSKIARHFDVTLDAMTYAMRKGGIERRTLKEAQALKFKQKPMSFTVKKLITYKEKQIATMGTALYWAEGYKTSKSKSVDFANSDPQMIATFMKFLDTCYILDKNRLRASIYAYSNQDIKRITTFWSNLTNIPMQQFIKPYIRKDFNLNGRIMLHGLVHIRYNDKKLLSDILERIEVLKTL